MKIVIAIDSFKGCASSKELSSAIKKGIIKIYEKAEIIICPIADGGEGTLEAFGFIKSARLISAKCTNPLGIKITANYLLLDNKTAVIEMASASGLDLISKENQDPFLTTSFGTGELIKDAINKGYKKFIIALGGSATNDAGIGMLLALGYKFYDALNKEVRLTKDISKINSVDSSFCLKELNECEFLLACDVNNPLTGANGASYIYALQKGAKKSDLKILDESLKHFAYVAQKNTLKKYDEIPGAGSAGGLGFAFLCFLNAKIKPGIEIILKEVDFEHKILNADVVITGEGKIDEQSCMGKVIDGIGKICKMKGLSCIAFTGNSSNSDEKVHAKGITSVFSILNEPLSLQEAMNKENTLNNIEKISEQIFRLIYELNKPTKSENK